jgi:hypothetical protein
MGWGCFSQICYTTRSIFVTIRSIACLAWALQECCLMSLLEKLFLVMLLADLFCFYDSWVVYVFGGWFVVPKFYRCYWIELFNRSNSCVGPYSKNYFGLIFMPNERSHRCWVLLFVCMLWQKCKWQRVKEKWYVTCLVCCINCKVTKCM